MSDSEKKTVAWIAGGVILLVLIVNPFKQKQPDWQVIKEVMAGVVYCNDTEYDNEGVVSIGYAPCVRLTNIAFDSSSQDEYCYSADVEVGGYLGQRYEGISSWQNRGNNYYCVGWHAIYTDADVSNPEDWEVDFGTTTPADYVN